MSSVPIGRRRLLGWMGAAGSSGLAAGAIGDHYLGDTEPAVSADLKRLQAANTSTRVESGGLPVGLADRIPAFGQVLAIDLADDVRGSPRRSREAARALLRSWAKLATGDGEAAVADAAAGFDIRPASLQVTPGIGDSLLRLCDLGDRRPETMVDLPAFDSDELRDGLCGGDLVIQLAAEDPMRLAGAVQHVVSTLKGRAVIRWSRGGFRQTQAAVDRRGQTVRNLMGHRDGTNNPELGSPLWTSVVRSREPEGGGRWMDGGSYLVARRILIDVDDWFTEPVQERDKVFGRHTRSGAPFGSQAQHDSVNLAARDGDGNLVVPPHAHIRLASSTNTSGARIYRRSWNFDDGWSADGGRNAGLIFLAWQADPRRGFIPIQQALVSGADSLNDYTSHVGSALFAMPPQPEAGGYSGQELFEG